MRGGGAGTGFEGSEGGGVGRVWWRVDSGRRVFLVVKKGGHDEGARPAISSWEKQRIAEKIGLTSIPNPIFWN